MPDSYVRRASGTTLARLGGAEAVLVHIEGGGCYTINPLGVVLWDLADGTRTMSDLIGEVMRVYGVDATRASNDVRGFFGWLADEGLVSFHGEPTLAQRDR